MAVLSDSWKVDGLALLVGLSLVLYLFDKRSYSYWERRGFQTISGYNYFLGHFQDSFTGKGNFNDVLQKLYDASKEPLSGIYGIMRPFLFVRDPELVRDILIKDSSNFLNRGFSVNEDFDPLSGILFSLENQKWKNMRAKLTPTFTSGKLKEMFSTLVGCGLKLQNHLEGLSETGELLDIRDISARHSTNVIASVAFGIEVDTIKEPNHAFRTNGKKIFEPSVWNAIRGLIAFVQPKLMRLLRIKIVDQCVEDFIKSVVSQNLEYRETHNVTRKDFFQLLIQLRKDGTVHLDDKFKTVLKADRVQQTLTVDEMAAQTFQFFSAGFETTSSTLSFCVYELSRQPELMERAVNEVDRVLKEHNGQITYESIADMKYLENCIDETLRMYPPGGQLFRSCSSDYKVPGTNQIIEKGTQLFIPVHQMHNDEEYYPDPKKFDPDRFTEENLAGTNLINRPYYPFGDGPRSCIGIRLAKVQTRVALVMMLQKYAFKLEERLQNEKMKFDARSFALIPVVPIKLHVFKL